jgi:autotransporter-associated beta strand protein
MKPIKLINLKNRRLTPALHRAWLLSACCLAAGSAAAATEQWLGVPGVSASLNWTDTANWTPGVQQTYYNQVQFTGSGANANTDFSVNNILDATTGAAQMPIWELDYVPTNGNYTTLINPGVTLLTGAGWGSLYVGADALHNSSPAPANAVETITITGAGGTLNIGGNIYLGQGSDTPNDAHNVTLDLSGLDNFIDTGGQILVASTGLQRGNGSLYLAKTNQLTLGNNFQIANQSTSNSLPSVVYLGQQNNISIGSGDLTVGGTGSPAGARLQFNPAFLGGASAPTASFGSSQNGGRIANVVIGNANGGAYTSSSGAVDLSGGSVTVSANSVLLGQGGNAGANGFGSLTLDNGSVNANNVTVGNQAVGSGGTGVGVINLNSNSVLGASASLQVNNTLTLAAVAGTLTSGSAGTINVNGGALTANAIVNGAGAGSLNLANGTVTLITTAGSTASPVSAIAATNSVLNLTLQTGVTNITVAALKTGGATNVINILSAPPIASYPVQIPLIKYGSLSGTFNFGLGTLPPLYAGHLVHNTANGSVDLVLTAGSSTLTWTGASSGDWDFATANWTSGGSPAIYADGDFVQFFDGANNRTVNLTANVSPAGSIIVSNNSATYVFTGGGGIGGSGNLLKQGAGTLVVDNSGANTFTGNTTIDGGALQIGNNDANGNLPGAVVNNGGLIFARADSPTVSNPISGSGYIAQAASGSTLTLNGNNSFTGNILVTNNSALKLGSGSALGGGSNPIIVADGSTLDINGVYSSRPVIVSGNGTDGNGAIVDNGGAVYGFTSGVTLAGDTTFGYANRWDLANATLSTGGHAYNVTLTGNGTGSYLEWNNLAIDSALNDITIASVNLGLKGSTSLGDPNGSLILTPNGALTFYNPNVSINKRVDFQSGSSINVGGGDHVMAGALTLESGYDSFNLGGGTSLTLSNVLSGDGTIYLNGGNGSLILAGNSPAYTGNVLLYSGAVVLNGLIGGSITSQSGTTIAGSGTANGAVDIGGDLQPGRAGVAGTFHAAGGLTLEGGATLTCDLSASVSGDNDAVEVGGDLNVNGNNLNINPTGGGLANGTYTLSPTPAI